MIRDDERYYYDDDDDIEMVGGNIIGNIYSKISGQRFPDERHTPLYTDKGFKLGEYAGPSTHVKYRLVNKIEPINYTDKTAQAHDLRYLLSENIDDVRNADNKMIQSLEKAEKNKLDYAVNIKTVGLIMKSKRGLEDYGVWDRGSFSSMEGKKLNQEDRNLFRNKLNELEIQGFGLKTF